MFGIVEVILIVDGNRCNRCVCVYRYVHACVCVCVYVRESERERDTNCGQCPMWSNAL